jgi:hypothetical protein
MLVDCVSSNDRGHARDVFICSALAETSGLLSLQLVGFMIGSVWHDVASTELHVHKPFRLLATV